MENSDQVETSLETSVEQSLAEKTSTAESASEDSKAAAKPARKRRRKPRHNFSYKLPRMIRRNGLGQTLAFLRAQRNGAARIVYQDFAKLILAELKKESLVNKEDLDLLTLLMKSDSNFQRAATRIALACHPRLIETLAQGGNSSKEEMELQSSAEPVEESSNSESGEQ